MKNLNPLLVIGWYAKSAQELDSISQALTNKLKAYDIILYPLRSPQDPKFQLFNLENDEGINLEELKEYIKQQTNDNTKTTSRQPIE